MKPTSLCKSLLSLFVAAGAALSACGGGGGAPEEDLADPPTESPAGALVLTLPNHGPNAVALWSGIATDTYNRGNPGLPSTAQEQRPLWPVDLATVHLAMYDAAMAVSGTHRPYAFQPVATDGDASIDAAVGAAARSALAGLFPTRAAVYQPAYDAWLTSLPDDAARARGVALGEQAAAAVLALRGGDDGRSVVLPTFVPGTLPGDFRGLNPITPWFAYVKPFALRSAAQFRADGPPALTSRRYAREWQQVRDLGSSTSTLRTAEQTEIARSHTELPNTYWPRNFAQFATSQVSVADNARLMAMIWTAMADTLLGCFESKYHHLFWRPASAITLADSDDNPATVADPAWQPLGPVPNHPEYPAAHACIAGALSETLREAFGTRRLSFSFASTVTGTTHHYRSIDEMAEELQVARIWGGMHFRTSLTDGATLGRQTTRYLLRRGFERCHGAAASPHLHGHRTACKAWSRAGDTPR